MQIKLGPHIETEDLFFRFMCHAMSRLKHDDHVKFEETLKEPLYADFQTINCNFTINGVEFDPSIIFETMEEINNEKDQRLQRYKSKNSSNAKLSKISDNLDRIYNEFKNIKSNIEELKNSECDVNKNIQLNK